MKHMTREERRQRRRSLLTGIAWLLSCVTIFCAAHYVADHLIVDTPMGIYAEEGRG